MRMLAASAVVASFITSTHPAGAETDTEYFPRAMSIQPDTIVGTIETYSIENGGDYDRMILGRYKEGGFEHEAAVLVRCESGQCWGQRVWLGNDTVEILGAIDLAGAPRAFPTTPHTRYDGALDAGAHATWPALVIRESSHAHEIASSRFGGTVEGEHRSASIYVLSLARQDRDSPIVLRAEVDLHSATGGGMSVSFAVDKDGSLLATEQQDLESRSACMRPKPVTVAYTLDAHRRFQRAPVAGPHGCS